MRWQRKREDKKRKLQMVLIYVHASVSVSVRQVQCVRYILCDGRVSYGRPNTVWRNLFISQNNNKKRVNFTLSLCGWWLPIAWCSDSERHSILIIEHTAHTLTLGRAIVNLPHNLHIKKKRRKIVHSSRLAIANSCICRRFLNRFIYAICDEMCKTHICKTTGKLP